MLGEDLRSPNAFLVITSLVIYNKSIFFLIFILFAWISGSCSRLERFLNSSSSVCLCREGRSSGSAGQCTSGRERALRCPRGDREASCVQSSHRRASALLQLCEHAETCAGECCVWVITSTNSRSLWNLTISIPCVQDHEINMLGEVTHLQTILGDLMNLTAEPSKLPPSSEQVTCPAELFMGDMMSMEPSLHPSSKIYSGGIILWWIFIKYFVVIGERIDFHFLCCPLKMKVKGFCVCQSSSNNKGGVYNNVGIWTIKENRGTDYCDWMGWMQGSLHPNSRAYLSWVVLCPRSFWTSRVLNLTTPTRRPRPLQAARCPGRAASAGKATCTAQWSKKNPGL